MRRFHRGNREDGAALVETALVLPMLFMLTIGIWTTARAWNVHNVMDHAAREAARYGATLQNGVDYTDAAGFENLVLTVANGELAASAVTGVSGTATEVTGPASGGGGCITSNTDDPTSDRRLQVCLSVPSYDLEFVFFSVNISLQADAVARREPGTA